MEEVKLKLSQFLDIIKWQFDDIIWYHEYIIEAEVKSIKKVRQFYYIDLVEIEDWKIIDSTRSNIFNGSVMTTFLREVSISDIQDLVWKKLLLTVRPTFHRTYNFSVNILKIHSDFFVWWLEKKKKENIGELKKRWVLYNNKSQEIWYPTFNIAIITWEKSEWFRDFKTILDESGYKYKLTVFNSLVHGEKASLEVLKQLRNIKQEIESWRKYNLVAIMRWWGWSDWMNWTNDFDLCLEVCNLDVPVMTAVWHTVDQSILDMISCYDCKTPSEWAQILIDIYDEFNENIEAEYEYITGSITDFSEKYKTELKFIWKSLPLQVSNRIRVYKQKLENFNIDRKIKYQSRLLWNKLEIIYNNIKSNNPNKILDKWYKLLYDTKWNVTNEVKVGNEYVLKSKAYAYLVEVKDKYRL